MTDKEIIAFYILSVLKMQIEQTASKVWKAVSFDFHQYFK